MRDRLPVIIINVYIPVDKFLTRIENLAIASEQFEVSRDIYGEGFRRLSIRFLEETKHDGLIGQVLIHPRRHSAARLEVQASKWVPDPPTYEVYVEAAHQVFDAILDSYNQIYRTKTAMQIPTKEDLEPKLTPGANEYFENFIKLANKESLNPSDWGRFYFFIKFCATHKIKLESDDVFRLLVKNGFDEDTAYYMNDIFLHGIALLRTTR